MTRYERVPARKAEGFPITMTANVAGVSKQVFNDWRARRAAGGSTPNQGNSVVASACRSEYVRVERTGRAMRATTDTSTAGIRIYQRTARPLCWAVPLSLRSARMASRTSSSCDSSRSSRLRTSVSCRSSSCPTKYAATRLIPLGPRAITLNLCRTRGKEVPAHPPVTSIGRVSGGHSVKREPLHGVHHAELNPRVVRADQFHSLAVPLSQVAIEGQLALSLLEFQSGPGKQAGHNHRHGTGCLDRSVNPISGLGIRGQPEVRERTKCDARMAPTTTTSQKCRTAVAATPGVLLDVVSLTLGSSCGKTAAESLRGSGDRA